MFHVSAPWKYPVPLVQDSLRAYVRCFPHDTTACLSIDKLLELRTTSRSHEVLVGVFYGASAAASPVLQALLADPLASGNQEWYRLLEARSRQGNNYITSPECPESSVLPEAFRRTLTYHQIKSPMLEPDLRPVYPQVFQQPEAVPNNLYILELNKPEDVPKVADTCTYFIYVVQDLADIHAIPSQVRNKVLAVVVDNTEYTPRSTQATPINIAGHSTHVVKVDSSKLLAGIDLFLRRGTEVGAELFEAIQASNILELSKVLSYYSRTEVLRSWLFELIRSQIKANTLPESRIKEIYDDLKLNSLVQGSRSMHAELQNNLIPETTSFFKRNLRWWMLYYKNDNVSAILNDFFSKRFMPKSIESYNYIRGQLVARLQDQKFAEYTQSDTILPHNPLQNFKSDLINNRILLQVQPAVNKSLVTGLLYYQAPLTALSLVGYYWVGVPYDSALALALLGGVLGFNHVSKQWHEFTTKWLSTLFEDTRNVIAKECMDEGLLKELNSRFESATDLARTKQQVLETLNTDEVFRK